MARLRYRSDSELNKEEPDFHHNVYVILLDPKVAEDLQNQDYTVTGGY